MGRAHGAPRVRWSAWVRGWKGPWGTRLQGRQGLAEGLRSETQAGPAAAHVLPPRLLRVGVGGGEEMCRAGR